MISDAKSNYDMTMNIIIGRLSTKHDQHYRKRADFGHKEIAKA